MKDLARTLSPDFHKLIEKSTDDGFDPSALFFCALESGSFTWALALLDKLNLLDSVLPELTACRGVEQNGFHHLGVFGHTLLTVGHAERIALLPSEYFGNRLKLAEAIRQDKSTLLLSALFHDLGKPETREQKEDGHYSFYSHEVRSAEQFGKIARRLKIEPSLAAKTQRLIRGHMRIAPLSVRYLTGQSKDKAMRRFHREFSDIWPALAALGYADMLATRGPLSSVELVRFIPKFCDVLEDLEADREHKAKAPKLPLDGKTLMEAFGLPPGPEVGRMLNLAKALFAKNPEISEKRLLAMIDEKWDR